MQSSLQNTNRLLNKSTTFQESLLQKVLDFAKQKGATDAEVVMHEESGFGVDVRMGAVETISSSEGRSFTVVVYLGHRKGSSSSTDLSEASLQSLVQAAYDIASVSAEDPCFGLADPALLIKNAPDLDLFHPWDLSPEQAIQDAIACEAYGLNYDPAIVNSDGVSIANYLYCNSYASSQGAQAVVYSTSHSRSCSLLAKQGDSMQREYEYSVARDARHLKDLRFIGEEAAKLAKQRLGARPIRTQKVPVVFSNRLSGGVIGCFMDAISGSSQYRKQTFLLDSIGKTVFPSWVKIEEEPYLPGALGSSAFDGDGVMTRPNVFVEDGCIRQYVLGCYSARRLGLETTANSGGVYNLRMSSNIENLEEILSQMGSGLLVTELMGQGVNLMTGDYSRGANGFWVEGG
ncbi:MAG: metallopeptidase TldD-related protein, partial [Legionellaceae bacterium]|nr:metallopeptidase TldD-related protein [Legionellaceae bacterium]